MPGKAGMLINPPHKNLEAEKSASLPGYAPTVVTPTPNPNVGGGAGEKHTKLNDKFKR